jgi:hypothetical protein
MRAIAPAFARIRGRILHKHRPSNIGVTTGDKNFVSEVSDDTSRGIRRHLPRYRPVPPEVSTDRKKTSEDTIGADNRVTDDNNEVIDAIQRRHRRLRSSRPATSFLSSVTSFWASMP